MKNLLKKNRHQIFGILLAAISLGILGLLGIFFWGKFTSPPSLSKLLPANSTLLFFELKTNFKNTEAQQLTKIFTETSATKLFELNSLGFEKIENFSKLADRRVGIAFFGDQLDLHEFLLVLDITERESALHFLRNQTIPEEKLVEEKYLGQKFYIYPRSRELAFMFRGNDLLLASNANNLREVIASIRGASKRVSDSENYHAIINNLNSRTTGFGYFSEKFISQFFTTHLGGIKNALATPLLNLWNNGGITFEPRERGIAFKIRLALKDKYLRDPLFFRAAEFNPDLLNAFDENVKKLWATENATEQLSFFLERTNKINPAFELLMRGSANKITREWLGEKINFEHDLASLFTESSIIGLTSSGGIVGAFLGSSAIETFDNVKNKLATTNGRIAATKQSFTLPDDTTGHKLVVIPETIIEKGELYRQTKITQLKFAVHELFFAPIGDTLFFSTRKEVLKKSIDRIIDDKKNSFGDLVKANQITGSNIFYSQIGESENPLLSPFHYSLGSLNFETDSITLDLFLGK